MPKVSPAITPRLSGPENHAKTRFDQFGPGAFLPHGVLMEMDHRSVVDTRSVGNIYNLDSCHDMKKLIFIKFNYLSDWHSKCSLLIESQTMSQYSLVPLDSRQLSGRRQGSSTKLITMKKIILVFLLGLSVVIMLPAQAIIPPTPITTTIDLSTVFSGAIPDGSAPWLQATFTSNAGSSTGTLTLDSLLTNPDFVQGGSNVSATVGWAFYLDTNSFVVGSCSGNCANNVFSGGSFNSGPVPGVFNLSFSWAPNNRFMGSDTATYIINFGSALTASPFVANGGGWSSVAHIQGIAGGCSGWIVAGNGSGAQGGTPCTPVNVPEPAVLGIFGLGILMIGLLVGLHRRIH